MKRDKNIHNKLEIYKKYTTVYTIYKYHLLQFFSELVSHGKGNAKVHRYSVSCKTHTLSSNIRKPYAVSLREIR